MNTEQQEIIFLKAQLFDTNQAIQMQASILGDIAKLLKLKEGATPAQLIAAVKELVPEDE